jgi:hypothetical protein
MCATQLPFPFWMLVVRDESPWQPVTLTPGYAAAFSTHTRACEFLTTSANPAWEVRLVVRQTVLRLADEFLRQGVVGIALDVEADGGGTQIGFGEKTELADR